jgi:hypothetical protein
MKYLPLFLLAGFWFSRATAADAPASVAELFATPENLRIVRSADRVDACILKHIEPTTKPDGSIDRSTERYEEATFVSVPVANAGTLRELLMSGKTYDWKAGSGGRRPQFYLRLRFHRGDELINVDFCFMCHVLSLTHKGEELGHANFSHNSDLFLQVFLQLFPEDKPLQQVAREAGLPP